MSRQTASSGSNHCGNSVPAAQHRRFEVMLKRAENRVCFDCGARQPRWASTNLGVFFCLRCAGIHRSLGVHISKVKSTNMDAWEEPMINFIEHVGNGRGRVLYEYNMSEMSKPRPNTETGVVERVLRAKYERKAYYNPNFTEVLAGFLRTPVTEGEDALHLVVGQSQADAAEAERLREQQRQEQEQQAAAQRAQAAAAAAASLEELWGAPVTTTGTTTAPAAPTVHDEVAELFASPVPAGHVPQRSSNPFWGMAAPHQSQLPSQPSSSSLNYYGAGSSTGSTGAPSPLGAVFPSPTSNTANSSVSPSRQSSGFPAPAPNPGRAPANNGGTRGASDDLFSSGPPASSSSASPSQQPKDEILSLFASAPPVGSYGGGGGAVGPYGQQPVQGNGAPYSAWQPHMVRPYYHPEK